MKNESGITLSKEIYTSDEVVDLFPRCTYYILYNYRWKYKIGKKKNHKLYFTKKEVYEFINRVELENIKMRRILYNYILQHPGIKDVEIYKYLQSDADLASFNFTKERTANLLADISELQYQKQFPGVMEDDEDRLYIINHEINYNKKYSLFKGIFFDLLDKKRRTIKK